MTANLCEFLDEELPEIKTRVCTDCGIEKSYDEFEPRNPRSPRGELYVRGGFYHLFFYAKCYN